MEGGFYFPPEVWEGAQQLANEEEQNALFSAVVRFSFSGEEPEFQKGSVLAVSWYYVRSSLERMSAISKERRMAGKKGGENSKQPEATPKQTESKPEATPKQTESKPEATPKQTESKPEANGKPNTNTNTNTNTNINSFLFAPDDESTAAIPDTQAKARDNPSGKAKKIDFDFDRKEWVNITDEWIAFWRKTYPAVDVEAELQRMAAWLVSDPTRKKKNYAKAINFWLGKEQDKGGRSNGWANQYRPVESTGRLDPGGRPEVIRGADYGTGANIFDFIGGGGDKAGGST